MRRHQTRIMGRGLIAILAAMATWTDQPAASAAEEFSITEIEPSQNNGVSIRFPSDLATYYTLTRATTLEQFMSAVAMQRGTASEGLFIQPVGTLANPSAFFRVVRNNLASPGDADGDGLDDVFELDHQPGLDPLMAAGPEDSDFDGLSDWTESRYRSNPFAREWLSPIAAGADFSLGIQSDGSMFGWGGNVGGQLGQGTWSLPVPSPYPVAKGGPWLSVVARGGNVLAIHADHSLWTWGANTFLAAVSGPAAQPKRIQFDNDWLMVAIGASHGVGIKHGGTLWSWGLNNFGQLGTGDFFLVTAPVRVGNDANWWIVSAAESYCLALRTNGTLWAWGDNGEGQLGDGSTEMRNAPRQTGTATDWFRVSAGTDHCLALKQDGSLWAWGANDRSQLGNGTTNNLQVPARIGGQSDWQEVWAGNQASYALKRDGSLWAWGDNVVGRLGLPLTVTVATVPQRVGDESDWITVSPGDRHALGLKRGGRLICWGEANQGQLGDGNFGSHLTPVPIDLSGGWIGASASFSHALAVKADGSTWAWGENYNRELGTGDDVQRPTPVRIGAEIEWTTVETGGAYSSGIDADGFAWFWGAVDVGGGGLPGKVLFSNPIKLLSSSGSHGFAIDSAGKLHGRGGNSQGAVGTGMPEGYYPAFVAVAPAQTWKTVSAGIGFSCGIDTNGLLWSWGLNDVGQLGNATLQGRNIPSLINLDTNWSRVSAGTLHSLASKSDGSLWTWGDNSYGQLGLGAAVTTTNVPVRLGLALDWKEFSAGYRQSLAIKQDGSLWYWGRLPEPGAEVDPTRSMYQPQQLGSDSDWSKVYAGANYALMIKSNGTLWGWGESTSGRLGQPYARKIELGGSWGPGGP